MWGTVPLAHYGPRPNKKEVRRDRGDISIYLAFSGGGTRAAALAFGAGIDLIELAGSWERAGAYMETAPGDKMAVIIVNAETDPDPRIDLTSAAPGFASLMNAVSGGQIRRYNFETLLLTQELLKRLGREARDKGVPMQTFLVEVNFENLPDPRSTSWCGRGMSSCSARSTTNAWSTRLAESYPEDQSGPWASEGSGLDRSLIPSG